MSIEIKVPELPESVADATIATWHVKVGEAVSRDQSLADIETDKVVLEVVAPSDGVLTELLFGEGDTVLSKQVIAQFATDVKAGQEVDRDQNVVPPSIQSPSELADTLSPSVRRLIMEHNLDVSGVTGTGVGGRITKDDIDALIAKQDKPAESAPVAKEEKPAEKPAVEAKNGPVVGSALSERNEKRVRMTRLRKRIAERMLGAKNSTAMLTTFNEVNMAPIITLRKQYRDIFEQRHGVRLGYMSFYVKAVVEALKRYPEINASIDGEDMVYHDYFDISIAVSTPRGLVTPVLRDADKLSVAEIETGIRKLAAKAESGKLTVDDLAGGNFTITNGGVFGSLMSTPIINPPQSAILGMHAIKDRPVAIDGEVVIQPMMYLAVSYDHRIIDGRESVGFLVTIKEFLEDPTRLLLDI